MWGLRLCCLSRRGEAIARGIFTGEGFRATAHARPIASPLRNCRTGPFYHSDRQTPPPLILRRGSARAAPAPPAVITQRSHRGRGVQATRPIASPLRNCRAPFTILIAKPLPRSYFDGAQHERAPPAVITQRSSRERGSGHVRPIASPLRNCRTGPFYHSDRQTPPPLILRRGSARAAPAPPAVITQRSHRGRGVQATVYVRPIASPLRNCRTGPFYHSDRQTPPPLILRRASARAAPAPPAVVTQRSRRGRGGTSSPLP